jgi:hypothetical protein|tara:strand:- start:43 stop:975 length:933 start_codon:yes stop_codon:yes gene_type:complete
MAKPPNNYSDYNKLLEKNYTIKELKNIMKHFSYKPKKKRKNELFYECYHYLKNSYYIRKIIYCFRNYIVFKINKTQGPAIFKRELCNNTEDFLTTETMRDIEYKFFISYKDNHNFIYGFNLISISTLLDKHGKNNPYTMEPFPEYFITMVETRKKYNKLLNYTYETIQYVKQTIDNKFVSIFQKLDSLGNYTQTEWLTQLNNKQLRKFIYEIYDIWMYRSQLSQQDRIVLCPPIGNPFINIPMYLFNNRNIHIENTTLKNYIYTICDNLINNVNIDQDKQSLCAIYILTTFTLVNNLAAESLPWLYQSVI